jgi:glycine oxidase
LLCQELHRETDLDCEWIESGLLVMETAEQPAASAWAAQYGAPLTLLEATQVEQLAPVLAAPTSALSLPAVGQVRNPRLAKALTLSLQQRGVTVFIHTELTQFCRHGTRITGVQTSRGNLRAKTVVLTAGAWSAPLLQGLGMDLPLVPIRGQMVLIQAEPGLLKPIILKDSRYLIPRRDGRILVGSTLESVGFQKQTTEDALQSLLASAYDLVPSLADYPVELHWAGLRPASPQGVPFIGAAPGMQGLFLNAGHFRNGVVLAPASAHLAADLLLARPPIVPPAPYCPSAQRPADLSAWFNKAC